MSISNDQTAQGHNSDKVNPETEATKIAAEQAKAGIKARIEDIKKEESYLPYQTHHNHYSYHSKKWHFPRESQYIEFEAYSSLEPRYRTMPMPMFMVSSFASSFTSAFALIKSAAVTELAAAEEQEKIYKAFYDRFAVIDHKLAQVPIISNVVQLQGNTIDSGIDETKALRRKIYELSDRLDSYERLSNDLSGRLDSCERTNKFICSVYNPALLDGEAKEMYGLICPKVGHDEL